MLRVVFFSSVVLIRNGFVLIYLGIFLVQIIIQKNIVIGHCYQNLAFTSMTLMVEAVGEVAQ